MILGKKRNYTISSKKYPGKYIRIILYNLINNKEKYKDTILFKHSDIIKLIQDHLENENYNDKNMKRNFSDFWRKEKNIEFLLEKIKREIRGR